MKELIISQIAPIAAIAIVAILIKIIYKVGESAIQLFLKLKEEVEQRIIASGHEAELKQAKEVWNIIEEKFRITENALVVLGSKADMFDQLLLKKIPGLTQQNLTDLRQAIAGEFNKGKAAVTQDNTTQQITNLQQDKAKLEVENASLKATLSQISSAMQPVATDNDIVAQA